MIVGRYSAKGAQKNEIVDVRRVTAHVVGNHIRHQN